MPNLAPELRADLSTFAGHRRILVALDFDGTLSPLVDRPQDARPSTRAAQAFDELARQSGVHTAVVSGRNLESLTAVYPAPRPDNLIGSHGAERRVPSVTPDAPEQRELTDAQRENLTEITARLSEVAQRHEGVNLEHKPSATVLHVRQAQSPGIAEAALAEGNHALAHLPEVRLMAGKAVLEASVHAGDKGQALQWLRQVLDVDALLFVGDDVTDEDGFRILTREDLGIKVGPGPTLAAHRISGPEILSELLELLLSMRD
ncbi:trehalose-phosphatase [Glutamicibacter sp. 287]|uniref:trehalose-phosphatase n=1 Tax=Micrococcaceae TaxID=1268 RepID=UPI001596AC75|nr:MULTISPECIES: trehalose-phosphatase [Micrococcaceae]